LPSDLLGMDVEVSVTSEGEAPSRNSLLLGATGSR
jgi:hypothetical protein